MHIPQQCRHVFAALVSLLYLSSSALLFADDAEAIQSEQAAALRAFQSAMSSASDAERETLLNEFLEKNAQFKQRLLAVSPPVQEGDNAIRTLPANLPLEQKTVLEAKLPVENSLLNILDTENISAAERTGLLLSWENASEQQRNTVAAELERQGAAEPLREISTGYVSPGLSPEENELIEARRSISNDLVEVINATRDASSEERTQALLEWEKSVAESRAATLEALDSGVGK